MVYWMKCCVERRRFTQAPAWIKCPLCFFYWVCQPPVFGGSYIFVWCLFSCEAAEDLVFPSATVVILYRAFSMIIVCIFVKFNHVSWENIKKREYIGIFFYHSPILRNISLGDAYPSEWSIAMAADDLATQGARASSAMVLTIPCSPAVDYSWHCTVPEETAR